MTAKEIYKALNNYYLSKARYGVENIYAFCQFYKETDYLVIQDNGYILDCEVKTSRADFKSEFKNKPLKHSILEKGYITLPYTYFTDKRKYLEGELIPRKRPNKYYFVVPENLISLAEVPHYAGLIYILESGEIKKIREAPFLTKEKIDLEPTLCRKFYYSYLELKVRNKDEEIERLKKESRTLLKELELCEKRKPLNY